MSGGWTWWLLDVIGVLVLGAIIAYGIVVTQRRRRDRQTERRREEATERLYEDRPAESPEDRATGA